MRQQMGSMKLKRDKAEREEWEEMGRKEEEKKNDKEEKKESWSGYKRGWIERGEGEIFGRSVSGRTCKNASVQTINKYEWKSGHGSWEARQGWFVHSSTRGWGPVAAHVRPSRADRCPEGVQPPVGMNHHHWRLRRGRRKIVLTKLPGI